MFHGFGSSCSFTDGFHLEDFCWSPGVSCNVDMSFIRCLGFSDVLGDMELDISPS